MNKIFKTLKNHRTGAATAVSELQTGRTKGSRLKAVAVAAVAAAALSSGVEALPPPWSSLNPVDLTAGNDGGVTHVGDDFAFGNLNVGAKTYSGDVNVLAGDIKLTFGGLTAGEPNTTLKLTDDDPNTLTLFAQSQGFDQVLVQANDFHYLGGVSFSVSTGNPEPDVNIFQQFLEQNGDKVALARYIIGTRAQNLGVIDGRDFSSDHDAGMRWDSKNIYTATVLSEVQLLNGKTITLNVPGAQNWGAHLTGEGSVSYVGDNKAEDVVTIKQLYESNKPSDAEDDHLDLANDYTGATTATNVTLNLERETSLGSSGILNATNANIVEVNEGALGTLNTIDFTDTDLTMTGTSLAVVDAKFAGVNSLRSGSGETIAFEAGTLEIAGADLTASSVNVTGNMTATGTNTLRVTDKVTVGGEAKITSGSLSTGSVAFESKSLVLDNAALTASSVTVNENATVSGKSTVTAGTFETTKKLTLASNSSLDASGNLTAQTADLIAGSSLSADGGVTVNGQLTMHDSAIDADQVDVWGSVSLTGANKISTTKGATLHAGDLILSDGTSLTVTEGLLTANKNVAVTSGSTLDATNGLNVAGDVTVGTDGTLHVKKGFTADATVTVESGADLDVRGGLTVDTLKLETSGLEVNAPKTNFFADRLTVGRTLAFEGESSSDNLYIKAALV